MLGLLCENIVQLQKVLQNITHCTTLEPNVIPSVVYNVGLLKIDNIALLFAIGLSLLKTYCNNSSICNTAILTTLLIIATHQRQEDYVYKCPALYLGIFIFYWFRPSKWRVRWYGYLVIEDCRACIWASDGWRPYL